MILLFLNLSLLRRDNLAWLRRCGVQFGTGEPNSDDAVWTSQIGQFAWAMCDGHESQVREFGSLSR